MVDNRLRCVDASHCIVCSLFDQDLGFAPPLAEFTVEQFIPRPGIEAFSALVLAGAVALDIGGLCADSLYSILHGVGNEFEAVIRANERVVIVNHPVLPKANPLCQMNALCERGDRPYRTDRLDAVRIPMRLNEVQHQFDGQSGFGIARHADACRRISLAWRSSRFPAWDAFILSAKSPGTPVLAEAHRCKLFKFER